VNSINDGGPAFPVPTDPLNPGTNGMSLRDWFAGMAMQGMLSNDEMQEEMRKAVKDSPE